MSFLRLRTIAFVFFSLLAAVSLGGCGDTEPAERKAFIEFLQKRIIDVPGIRTPKLTPQDTKSLGRYTAQYDVMASFHADLDKLVGPLFQELAPVVGVTSLEKMAANQAAFGAFQSKVAEAQKNVEARKEKVKADYAAIKVPDDVKPVYDAAYNRIIVEPIATLDKLMPAVMDALKKYETLSAFLNKHKRSVKLSGMTAEFQDQALLDEFNAQLKDIQALSSHMQAIQREMRKMLGRG